MTSLRDINRKEWVGNPYLIELSSGRQDGQRFHWRDLPPIWRVPEPVPLHLAVEDLASRMPIAVYRQTGSVTDDGAHVYEFDGYE